MTTLLRRFLYEDEGQDLVEYVLLVALISLGAIAAMSFLSSALNTKFTDAGGSVNSAT